MQSERIAPLTIERLRVLQDLARYGPDVVSMAQEIEALRDALETLASLPHDYAGHHGDERDRRDAFRIMRETARAVLATQVRI